MKIWAIGDPHLSFQNGQLAKPMDCFGVHWVSHPNKIAEAWKNQVAAEDLVCVVGDISWAMHIRDVKEDIAFFQALPGTKIFIRGNHDYWWSSLKKVNDLLTPPDVALNGNVVSFGSVHIGGVRLWDVPGLEWLPFFPKTPKEVLRGPTEEDLRILEREVVKLKLCLEELKKKSGTKILLLHYPPSTPDLVETSFTKMIEDAGVEHCVFGHLHGFEFSDRKLFYGSKSGVHYHLVSADFVDFSVKKIVEVFP